MKEDSGSLSNWRHWTGGSQPTSPVVVSRMGRKSSYVPLTQEELDTLGTVFHVAGQARVNGSAILNSLLMHVSGVAWESCPEFTAARLRLRRSARKKEFAKLYSFVVSLPEVFSPERQEDFRRLAVLESQVAARLPQAGTCPGARGRSSFVTNKRVAIAGEVQRARRG